VIARVFPRRTNATPDDEYAFVGDVPLFRPSNISEVHVSVTFSWDIPEAWRLMKSWGRFYPVKIGGPAMVDRGVIFEPGKYLKRGYVITSRGCPNNCWFCDVPRREGTTRELPITKGNDVLDPNLLSCSQEHISAVFAMLSRQKEKARFTGGLEAKRIDSNIAAMLRILRPETIFCAYDTPDDLEPLQKAGNLLIDAGFTRASKKLRAYVLCGWKNDTHEKARGRMFEAWQAGFFPFGMVLMNEKGTIPADWVKFGSMWKKPPLISKMLEEIAASAGKGGKNDRKKID